MGSWVLKPGELGYEWSYVYRVRIGRVQVRVRPNPRTTTLGQTLPYTTS
ncbi:MAG: hypothetical protein ACP5L1_10010 [Caldivirga sp.]